MQKNGLGLHKEAGGEGSRGTTQKLTFFSLFPHLFQFFHLVTKISNKMNQTK